MTRYSHAATQALDDLAKKTNNYENYKNKHTKNPMEYVSNFIDSGILTGKEKYTTPPFSSAKNDVTLTLNRFRSKADRYKKVHKQFTKEYTDRLNKKMEPSQAIKDIAENGSTKAKEMLLYMTTDKGAAGAPARYTKLLGGTSLGLTAGGTAATLQGIKAKKEQK